MLSCPTMRPSYIRLAMELPACADVSPLVANATADAAAVATTSRLQRQQQQQQGLREIARHHSVPRRCVTPADPSVSRVIGTQARWSLAGLTLGHHCCRRRTSLPCQTVVQTSSPVEPSTYCFSG